MGILKKLQNLGLIPKKSAEQVQKEKNALLRRCQFEIMEPRIVLTGDPVIAGVTYIEGDGGQDNLPDHFEVTFEGGSETTQLAQFVINGDQDNSGNLSDGDVFFDIGEGLPGAGGSADFQFDAANSSGITEDDILGISVSENGLELVVDVQNFEAGDVFAFTIDVDEVENLSVDQIASGVEFEASTFQTTFVDPHYRFENQDLANTLELNGFTQNQTEGIFYNYYDGLLEEAASFAGTELDLINDNETGQADRSAAAVEAFELVPEPVTISGNVYHDENIDCVHDEGEDGIEGVFINLQRLNDSTGQYETIASTTTDAAGFYEFGEDLNLTPGTFRLVQAQPDGFIDVGAVAGVVNGEQVGEVFADDNGNDNVISDIHIPLGNTAATDYDFKEVRPVSLSGNVYHDRNDDGVMDPGEEGIANVLIQVTRIDGKPGTANDAFADLQPIFVRTDANGHYSVDALPPGVYEIIEINNDPEGGNPLESFVDGKDTLGNVRGEDIGTQSNDSFTQVALYAGDDGVEYNFGELRPSVISGFVSISTPEGDCLDPSDPNHTGIAGVTLQLLDADGNLLEETQTDANGFYEFDDLRPGDYTIMQIQPSEFLDGGQHIGDVDGVENGLALTTNKITSITLTSGQEGTNYNFCEHIPAEIHGTVFHDVNDDGVRGENEEAIGGVTIQLLDEAGNFLSDTQTNASGEYWFTGLTPGTYTVKEIQPDAFADGQDSVGSIDGVTVGEAVDDMFMNITLEGGDQGINYDFGEIRLASISGTVHADANGDCVFHEEDGDEPLPNVTIELLDAEGNLVATTVTDENGDYEFTGLRPGEYMIREISPEGFLDGDENLGTIDGEIVGTSTNDKFSNITLSSGDAAVNYDFCEHIPAQIHGAVWHDANNDGIIQSSEERIANVTIQLFDEAGELVAETQTTENGEYWFTGLLAGTYKLQEIQPEGFDDGMESLGDVNGEARGEQMNDMFVNIELTGGERGENFNFGEIQLASISGFVHVDMNGNCALDANSSDNPLADVTLELLDADGNVLAITTTDENGFYEFDGLLPGEYAIREQQPDTFFDGVALVGTLEGDDDTSNGMVSENLIEGITISSGQTLAEYNFCEHPAAEIHGRVFIDGPAFETEDGQVPDNHRDLRDGIYQPGVDTPLSGVRLFLYFFNDLDGGQVAPRQATLADVDASFYSHLDTSDPNAVVFVETNGDGEYWFQGLQAGNYIVLEEQPEGVVDGNEIVGTTTGFAVNDINASIPLALSTTFSDPQLQDTINNINVEAGGVSLQNNFTEVTALQLPPEPTPPDGEIIFPALTPPPTRLGNPLTPSPGVQGLPGLFGSQPSAFTQFVGTSRGANFQDNGPPGAEGPEHTWHLSVVNGGQPRAVGEIAEDGESIWLQASYINDADWQRFDMTQGEFVFTETTAVGDIVETGETLRFGMLGGTPLAGDFDGDGTDEVAVFKDGYWMIDINHNGVWDEQDLIAKLGDSEDRPVVGDWDGDGKDDIGIYGPIWERDMQAIANEPGLPNPDNDPNTKPKNIPPTTEDATNGSRVMKLTSYGRQRVDVVDHVFGTGDEKDTPITGDWNGNGIRSIGYFNAGQWQFDVNGDGRFSYNDATATFGRAGDIPLVGDFDGDGIEEIAVYRSGVWLIDSNGNRELDATDKTFRMGGAGDQPVVGDWDGDGIDEPGLYRQSNVRTFE